SFQSILVSGDAGLPSYKMMVLPVSNPPTRKFHIIHPVVVNQKKRSPFPRSLWNVRAFRCSSKMPPWLWTIGFGFPVVPDENKTHKGLLNGPCSYVSSSSADVIVASCHSVGFFKLLNASCLVRYGIEIVAPNEGRLASRFTTTDSRSKIFPPYSEP